MKILIAEDEKSLRLSLTDELLDEGFKVSAASTGEEAVEMLAADEYDLVICDLVLPGISGAEVLAFIKKEKLGTGFVLITANPSLDSAIKILKQGALDYLCKPFDVKELLRVIRGVRETVRLKKENEALRLELHRRHQFHNIIGKSAAMQRVFNLIDTVSKNEASVLIEGETGTGKEVVAEAIHYNSSRRNMPLVAVNCATLSGELLESELFGHEKGAFTGAIRQKKGRFEMAHKGTLFLDDVDDMPLDTQVKLLRVLQTGKIERVGGEEPIEVDVRVLAATKNSLVSLVEQGLFRKDLYYRIHVIQINLPPLREKKEDIPLLVDHFLNKYSPDRKLEVSTQIMEVFLNYDWDGNVRELEHVVERLVMLQQDGVLDKGYLPAEILKTDDQVASFRFGATSLKDYLEGIEKNILVSALEKSGGSKKDAARLLDIPLPTLKSKLAKYQLY